MDWREFHLLISQLEREAAQQESWRNVSEPMPRPDMVQYCEKNLRDIRCRIDSFVLNVITEERETFQKKRA